MIKVDEIEIKVVRGDITALKVDAIVNPANGRMRMERGLAGVIRQKGGAEIEQEAAKSAPVAPGRCVVTSGGKLPFKIIHAVTTDEQDRTSEHIIRAAAAGALKAAAQGRFNSIAIPALGCGTAGFPVIASAKIMSTEILKFARYTRSSVREVTVCIFDEPAFAVFEKEINGYITHVIRDLGKGPYITVDAIIEVDGGIVLIERTNPPFGWALPGGFVDYGESLEDAVVREAKEETGLDLEDLRQFHTYSDPGRDPRFHTVATTFVARGRGKAQFGDDAKGLKIVPAGRLGELTFAFDHNRVIGDYLKWKAGIIRDRH